MPMARRLGPGMLGHTGFTGRNWKLHEMMVGTCGTFVLETSTQQSPQIGERPEVPVVPKNQGQLLGTEYHGNPQRWPPRACT